MKMVKGEFKNLLKHKILLISAILLTIIPIFYLSIFDRSLWNSSGEIKHLPVAVVNEDESADLLGQNISIGDQVVANLKKNRVFDWYFVSKTEAEIGLKERDYYMILTLPKNFSQSAVNIINQGPEKMEILCTTNDSRNYSGKEITEESMNELERKIRDQVVQDYASAIDTEANKLLVTIAQTTTESNELAGSGQIATEVTAYKEGMDEAGERNPLAIRSSHLEKDDQGISKKFPHSAKGINEVTPSIDHQLPNSLSEWTTKSPELVSGINHLKTTASEFSKESFTSVSKTETMKVTDKQIASFVGPTELKNKRYSKFDNGGEGLAPYLMSLGLFLGCLLFNYIYPIRKKSMDNQSRKKGG